MSKQRLREYLVSEKLWNKIIEYYTNYDNTGYSLFKAKNKEEFLFGDGDKTSIHLDINQNSMCISSGCILELSKEVLHKKANVKTSYRTDNDWLCYQQILTLDIENGSDDFANLVLQYSPALAVREHNKVLHKYYTDDEIEECLSNHSQEKWNKQLHDCNSDKGVIKCFKDCRYYDINGAHTYLLSQIFPRAKKDYEYWNAHKHDKGCEHYKDIPNFTVGCLGKKGSTYRNTYNWIVDNVNKIMYKAFEIVNTNGTANYIYVNTDGFIVNNFSQELNTSKNLGEFKEEYRGDVYTYRGDNYTIVQYGDIIKGNLPKDLRKYVDLRVGKVINFVRVPHEVITSDSEKYIYYTYENVNEEIINEQEIC